MYGVIALMMVLLFLGLFCVIKWRNNRVLDIQWLQDEIKKYKDRNKANKHKPLNEEVVPDMGT